MIQIFLIAASILTAQTDSQETTEAPRTNSGDVFQDPFADPGAQSPATQENQPSLQPEESPAVLPTPEENPETPPSVAPEQAAPAIVPEPSAPVVRDQVDEFQLPKTDEVKGPVDQDVYSEEKFERAVFEKNWFLMVEPIGAGFNLKKRKNQYHGEVEGGYRFSRNFELSMVIYARFYKDRMLGFLFMPYYILPIGDQSKQKNEMRFGLGTGWTLLGVRDYDYQIGYWPIRVTANHLYYFTPRIALSSGIDYEAYVSSVDTDGNQSNLLGKNDGPYMEVDLNFGVRFDF